MGDFRYVPKRGAVAKIMKSRAVENLVGEAAADVAARASNGRAFYGSKTRVKRVSAHGYAYTGNYAAMRDNAENDTLNKSL